MRYNSEKVSLIGRGIETDCYFSYIRINSKGYRELFSGGFHDREMYKIG